MQTFCGINVTYYVWAHIQMCALSTQNYCLQCLVTGERFILLSLKDTSSHNIIRRTSYVLQRTQIPFRLPCFGSSLPRAEISVVTRSTIFIFIYPFSFLTSNSIPLQVCQIVTSHHEHFCRVIRAQNLRYDYHCCCCCCWQ